MKHKILIGLFLLNGCLFKPSSSKTPNKMSIENLNNKLAELSYRDVFLYNSDLVNSIWREGRNKEKLEKIALLGSGSSPTSFLAAEILKKNKVKFNEEDHTSLTKSYCYALQQTSKDKENLLGLSGNMWGFLFEMDDAGELGTQLISHGEKAIPCLIDLLNDSGRVMYEGSKEATIGNAYNYRIKDFAAFYISKIKNIPLQFHQDLKERDREIERFKKLLKS